MEKTKKENNGKHVRSCNVEDEDKNIQEMIHKKLMKISRTIKGMGYEVTFDGGTINGEKFRIFNKHGQYFVQFAYDFDPVLAGMLVAELAKSYNVEVDWDSFYVNDEKSYIYHGDVECEQAYEKDMRARILRKMLADSK